jgi:hypothetical protein
MLKGGEAGTFCGRVGFVVAPLLAEQNAKLASARSRNERASASLAIERFQAAGNTVEIRPLVTDYYRYLKEYRNWLRKELVNVWSCLSADLERWASEDDRPAVIHYYIDNPIPVFRPAEE